MAEKKKQPDDQVSELPPEVVDLLAKSNIGYLSVRSPKGDLYSYPVAFYYSDYRIYFMTPTSAAKLRFIRANPAVSFLVDNHLVTKEALGVMMQGDAKVLSVTKTVISILSVGPKMVKFAQKYPGMFTFYAKGKEVPDERKLHKYRLIRITPAKLVFWKGYAFGRVAIKEKVKGDPLAEAKDDEKMSTLASLLDGADRADDELVPNVEIMNSLPEWNASVKAAVKEGTISDKDRSAIESYRSFLRIAAESNKTTAAVGDDERQLLSRWKRKEGTQDSG